MPDISQPAPDFTMPVTGGGEISLSDLRGKIVVLYFYPRDDTPGCTTEAIEFSADLPSFRQAGTEVFGISRDTLAKHDRFAAKHDLTVPLLADVDGAVTQAYDVWVEKNMYGKKMMGIERATFLIDAQGNIARIWRKVKVAGHVQEVLNAVRTL
tara:strand:- start:27146 stop:27607 length:462 start_codon:yes stop_codon:yes gene_type:complete